MELTGRTDDYILLIDEYFKKFHEHLEQRSVSNEKSVDAFLNRHNLKVVEASIELIQRKAEPTTLQLIKLRERVISHSLREGVFDVKEFNKSIEDHQEEFAKVIKFLRRKDSSCDEAIKH